MARDVRLTPQQRRILELSAAHTALQIADILMCSSRQVYVQVCSMRKRGCAVALVPEIRRGVDARYSNDHLLRLRDMGLSVAEIAERTGYAHGTILNKVWRARRKRRLTSRQEVGTIIGPNGGVDA